MIYLELRRSSSMMFGLLRWSQSLQFLLVSLLLTSGCSSAQRSQRSRGVFCHFSPCFLHVFWDILSWGYRMVMPLTSCFLSATRPRKISKDLERSRKTSRNDCVVNFQIWQIMAGTNTDKHFSSKWRTQIEQLGNVAWVSKCKTPQIANKLGLSWAWDINTNTSFCPTVSNVENPKNGTTEGKVM